MTVDAEQANDVVALKHESERPPDCRVPQHVRTTHGPEGGSVLDIHHGQLFRLNVVGSRILELLENGLAVPEVADQLSREFGIERATAKTDVSEFVETLKQHQLLTSPDNPA